jgi:hypothetical protein
MRVIIMKKLLLLTTFLLVLFSCSPEEVKIESATSFEDDELSFEDDELYGRLNNDSTAEDYINVFLEDAKRHGVDYTGLIQSTTIIWRDAPLYMDTNGGSWNSIDPFNTGINILASFWEEINFDGTYKDNRDAFPSVYFREDQYIPYHKLKLMYHELGHDILGLDHTCDPGQIMTNNEPCGRLYGNPGDIRGLYNMATLEYSNEKDQLVDWGRAIDDLFSGEKQIFLSTRSSFFD